MLAGLQKILALSGGAILGASLRYFCQSRLLLLWPTIPLGTFLVNVLGSFCAGFLFPVFKDTLSENIKIFVMVGFLGSLTTMSSFALEVAVLSQEKKLIAALVHWLGGAFLCIAAALLGIYLSQRWIGD